MRHLFIINPAAGTEDRSEYIKQRIKAWAARHGEEYEVHVTARPKHATEIARRCLSQYRDEPLRFYACGGDGTLNEVAAALIGAPNTALTHIPIGSGNDFIKSFKGADFLRWEQGGGEEHLIDSIDSSCGPAVNILSVGFDARVAASMKKYKSVPLLKGIGLYIFSLIGHFFKGLWEHYAVEIDGERFDGRYTLILAANGGFYGSGFMPMPDYDLSDGMLDILLVRDVSRLTVLKVIGAYKSGRYREYPQYIRYIKAREMKISRADGGALVVNLDGESVEAERVALKIRPVGLRFFTPGQAGE